MPNVPLVEAFFDEATFTVSYVVADPASGHCAVIDSVLDYAPNSGRTGTDSAERIVAFIEREGLRVDWLLETHIHADHLSALATLKQRLGGRTAIGTDSTKVQANFAKLFNLGPGFASDGRQFDHLFSDGEAFSIGRLSGLAMHTPGHTPGCFSYLIGDAVFVGDTLFMPDYGTARCDFPGGDARQLYRSIRKILALPPATRIFVCHDYKAPGREVFAWQTTVGEQRARNIHINEQVGEDAFVAMRQDRDRSLAMPTLLLPSVQVNIRGGCLPPAEDNGVRYLKIPLDVL